MKLFEKIHPYFEEIQILMIPKVAFLLLVMLPLACTTPSQERKKTSLTQSSDSSSATLTFGFAFDNCCNTDYNQVFFNAYLEKSGLIKNSPELYFLPILTVTVNKDHHDIIKTKLYEMMAQQNTIVAPQFKPIRIINWNPENRWKIEDASIAIAADDPNFYFKNLNTNLTNEFEKIKHEGEYTTQPISPEPVIIIATKDFINAYGNTIGGRTQLLKEIQNRIDQNSTSFPLKIVVK